MKKIYLTIDDAPSKKLKEKIDYLHRNKIPAIIFCAGNRMEEFPDEVIYAIRKGFVIGNHAYDHAFFTRLPFEQAKEEIKKTDDIINELYKKAKKNRNYKVFRFPYGDRGFFTRKPIQQYLRKLGYRHPKFEGIRTTSIDIYWTFDCLEWRVTNIRTIFKNIDDMLKREHNEIVLIHDNPKTHKKFFRIINAIRKGKVKFALPKFY